MSIFNNTLLQDHFKLNLDNVSEDEIVTIGALECDKIAQMEIGWFIQHKDCSKTVALYSQISGESLPLKVKTSYFKDKKFSDRVLLQPR